MDRKKALETLDLLYGIRDQDIQSVVEKLGSDALSDKALDLIAQAQLQEEFTLKLKREPTNEPEM
ncbi:hypothetical protein [Leptospirillum ferriphilum]|uniref:hypothetical protein n=1 Tax=Leptospirillum ferriphilum TaxID=178606 RepID=UPI0006B1CCD6|nr:hypothetical protein [Leptospirillum ferriphilum]